MVRLIVLLFGLTFTATTAIAQHRPVGFVLDESKPYVFIQFDHAGKRTPLSEDEPVTGLWLRLVNNCRVPISLRIFDAGKDNLGVGVYDEIISASASGFGYVDANGVSHGYATPSENPPKGYALDEVSSSTVIAPGASLLFSVPSNHVSRSWHLRVEFQLEPSKAGSGRQPHSFVEFTWNMIPEKDRPADPH
jgi:hypothetical protein